jgi:ABC-type sugar transport system ATPase subunit
MIALADRILVMADFTIVGTVDNDHDATRMGEAIMAAIHKVDEAA